MLKTEAEYKEIGCHRSIIAGSSAPVLGTTPVVFGGLCVGSKCPAWRWTPVCIKFESYDVNDVEVKETCRFCRFKHRNGRLGYCGAAGEPCDAR